MASDPFPEVPLPPDASEDAPDAPDATDAPETPESERRQWTLTQDAKFRLDKWLQNSIKGASRNQVRKLIGLGGVTVNGKQPKPSQSLRQGDVVEVVLPPRPTVDLNPEPIPLDVLYEDDDLIVVNKPAGLIVHPARTHLTGTLLNALAWRFQEAARQQTDPAKPQAALSDVGRDEARPGVVHRLDMNTTGVIIVAKRDETHWMLARQFEQRTNLKVYLAVVHGCPDFPGTGPDAGAGGAIDLPIGKHPTIREAMAVRFDPAGKESLTLCRVRERYEGYSLVELELKTGRTHQIRVHLSYLGCPIVGDVLYGGEVVGMPEILDPPRAAGSRLHLTYARDRATGLKMEEQAQRRRDAGELVMSTPALHAAMLQMRHPTTNDLMTFTAPVHFPMRELIAELRNHPAPGPVATRGTHLDLTQATPPVDV